MEFDCKLYCHNCVVCKIRAKPDRKEATALQPLEVPNYPWEIVGIDCVIDLPKICSYCYTTTFIVVCHLTKNDTLCFVPQGN